jgi:hypothetical protein
MNPNVLATVISAASSVAIAALALILNHQVIAAFNQRFATIGRKLEVIEGDMKEFNGILGKQSTAIERLKDRLGMKRMNEAQSTS